MRIVLAALLFSIAVNAQNVVNIIPSTTPGELRLWGVGSPIRYVALKADSTIPTTYRIIFPSAVPAAGNCWTVASIVANTATTAWAPCTGAGLLTSNNTWSGTNAYNAGVTFNGAFTVTTLPGVFQAGLYSAGVIDFGTVLSTGGTTVIDASKNATVNNLVVNGTCTGCGTGGLPVVDTTPLVKGSGDATKLLRTEVDGLTTATTRVWTAKDADITVAGSNIDNLFTANQTFHDVFCFTNIGCNIGATATRFNTAFIDNIEGAPAGGTTNYIKTRYLNLCDVSGLTPCWDMEASASPVTSQLTIRDNSGVHFVEFLRTFTGTPVNKAVFDATVGPSLNDTYDLGSVSKEWNNLYVKDANVSGTLTVASCVGCGAPPFSDSLSLVYHGLQTLKLSAAAIASGTRTITAQDANYIIAGTNINNNFTADQTLVGVNLNAFRSANDQTLKANRLMINYQASASNYVWTMVTTNDLRLLDNSGNLMADFDSSVNTVILAGDLFASGATLTRRLGIPAARWSKLYVGDIDMSGSFAGDVGINTTFFAPLHNPAGANGIAIRGVTDRGNIDFQSAKTPDADQDNIGAFSWTDLNNGLTDNRIALIRARLDGTTLHNRGGKFAFFTRPDGGSTVVERFNIDQAGLATFTGNIAAQNADFAPAGGIGNFTKVRHLAILDQSGGTAFWDGIADATGISSALRIRDNAGVDVLRFDRILSSSPFSMATLDMTLRPAVDATYDLGEISTPKRWRNAYFSGTINVGACNGCSTSGSIVTSQQYGAFCDGTSHPISSVFGTLVAAQAYYNQIAGVNVSNSALAMTDEIDWAAIQQGIGILKQANAAGISGGGVLNIQRGVCMINKVIDIGDGTASVNSSYQGITIEGQGSGKTRPGERVGATILQWNGVTSGSIPMVHFNGPIGGSFINNMLLDCDLKCGYTIWATHLFNGGGESIILHKPVSYGLKLDAHQTFPTGPGSNNNLWRQVDIKELNSCTSGGVQVGNDTQGSTGILDVARNDFYELDIVGNSNAGVCPSGSGTAIELNFTDSESFFNVYTLYMQRSVVVKPPFSPGGSTAAPVQIAFYNTYLNVTPILDESRSTWSIPDRTFGLGFYNYVQDGGGPAFPEFKYVRGATGGQAHYGAPQFVTNGSHPFGADTTALIIEQRRLGAFGGAIEFQATDTSTVNTGSWPSTPNNLFNSGRVYSGFDSASYGAARLTLQTPTGVGAWQDVLTVKGQRVGIGTNNPGFMLDMVNFVVDTSGNASGAIFSGTSFNVPTATNWNTIQTAGGIRFTTQQYGGFTPAFDPSSNPYSASGHVVSAGAMLVHLQKESALSHFVADAYGASTVAVAGLKMRFARGTLAAPTPAQAGDLLGNITAHGAFDNVVSGPLFTQSGNAAVGFVANENFSGTANGTRIQFQTTQNLATGRGTVLTLLNNGTTAFAGIYAGANTIDPVMVVGPTLSPGQNGGVLYNSATHKLMFSHDLTTWTDMGGSGFSGSMSFDITPTVDALYNIGSSSFRVGVVKSNNITAISGGIFYRDPTDSFNRIALSATGGSGLLSVNNSSGTTQVQLNGSSGLVSGSGFAIFGGFPGITGTATMRNSAGTGVCQISFQGGIAIGSTC